MQHDNPSGLTRPPIHIHLYYGLDYPAFLSSIQPHPELLENNAPLSTRHGARVIRISEDRRRLRAQALEHRLSGRDQGYRCYGTALDKLKAWIAGSEWKVTKTIKKRRKLVIPW
ncbi:MAG: hypothetical protein KGM95_05510 [Betaproteobacteria bacterium]|nr:hypothetical protein [Betaproteobacteria bacterium]